jgi:hypothetical protein
MLSTGEPSTLLNWHSLCMAYFGEESKATRFIESKIEEQGPDMEVFIEEEELLLALTWLDRKA